MRNATFLLEIGAEEIPARFIAPALKQLRETAAKELEAERLEHGEIEVFGTPRRLALMVKELALKQQDLREKKKGPAVKAAYDAEGKPTKAALGFARGQGVNVSELFTEEVNGVSYVFAERHEPGKEAKTILPALCMRLLRSLSFPKPMFWESKEVRFARPIRWLTALLAKEAMPFEFAGLTAANITYGHRFLAPEAIVLTDADSYLQVLQENFVIADPREREKMIVAQVKEKAAELNGETLLDPDLLEEVVNLVEYPKAVAGHFAAEYLEIPQEVLITAMRAHQRYFPIFDDRQKLLPHFITISNGTKDEYLENVRAGNERVLRARLADARFFFEEDSKQPLSAYVEELDKIVFMEQHGSMRKKTDRLVQLVTMMSAHLQPEGKLLEAAKRAAYLAKADLMTRMVNEFPELQGTMGMHYALKSGESKDVAVAIHEHYAPRFSGDAPPATLPGALVAIADKMDTMAACFVLGLIPTGSQDPFALRRGAAGVVATLLAHDLNISLLRLCELALSLYKDIPAASQEEVLAQMEEFLLQRLRNNFAEKGIRYDVIDAVLHGNARDLPGLLARAKLLQSKLETPELKLLLTPFTRAANLTKKAEPVVVNPELFQTTAEENLYQAVQEARKSVERAVAQHDFNGLFSALTPLYQPIDHFFDEVMVMVDDMDIRQNRLALLQLVKGLFLHLGDISKIVQEKK
ncbi:MAG: glycine--tRNA ligase subunit beta [Firmicutes bacterium]|nr:glycine--tRNA ligase subunit beta [Bacillota bacterium]